MSGGPAGTNARLRPCSKQAPARGLGDDPGTLHLLLKQNLRPGFKPRVLTK